MINALPIFSLRKVFQNNSHLFKGSILSLCKSFILKSKLSLQPYSISSCHLPSSVTQLTYNPYMVILLNGYYMVPRLFYIFIYILSIVWYNYITSMLLLFVTLLSLLNVSSTSTKRHLTNDLQTSRCFVPFGIIAKSPIL